jgi:hypothetical protein
MNTLPDGYERRDVIQRRVCTHVWYAFSDAFRGRVIDRLEVGKVQEILLRNNSRITIWNRFPR